MFTERRTIAAVVMITICISFGAYCQEEVQDDLDDLSLAELMNIPIASASKKAETVFEAPLSSYTITRSEIDRSGVTSIMEALRLCPGVIVREQANGVYDIHIRGFDNITRNSVEFSKSNLITLVMINDRPVFNHNFGGTFWESLPIDINDVDRIEIVRGPSAPLFGPNAASGVINIFTKRATSDDFQAAANGQFSDDMTIANMAIMKKFGSFTGGASINYQDRSRYDDTYFLNPTLQYVSQTAIEPIIPNFRMRYPNADKSLSRYGINSNIGYRFAEDVNVSLEFGTQTSQTQKNFAANVFTKFNTHESNSSYAKLNLQAKGITFRTSLLAGTDNIDVENPPNQYDYSVTNIDLEYEMKLKGKYSLVPGISYQGVSFDDNDYRVIGNDPDAGLLNNNVSISTISGYFRSDFRFSEKLRVLGAVRFDKFSIPDDVYAAYELAGTYKLNSRNLIRFAITRSNSGSFIAYDYSNASYLTPAGSIRVAGNKNLKLFTLSQIELGYRSQLSSRIQVDLDVFMQQGSNFTLLLAEAFNPTTMSPSVLRFNNIPTTATQTGVTIGLNLAPIDKLQIKPFITLQQTKVRDLPTLAVDPDIIPVTYFDDDHEATPSTFGGYYINYSIGKKLNFNLNGYFFSSHRQYDRNDPQATSDVGDIKSKILTNCKLNWSPSNLVDLFINGRNIFDDRSYEFFGTDRTGASFLAGVSIHLN